MGERRINEAEESGLELLRDLKKQGFRFVTQKAVAKYRICAKITNGSSIRNLIFQTKLQVDAIEEIIKAVMASAHRA